MKLLHAIALSAFVATTLAGCSASFCKRKDNFFRNRCAGAVAYNGDPMCESFMEKCTDAQLAAANAYVTCLESINQCSLDAVSQCAAQHPNGVNLMCTGA